jgi:hypothetical protein
MRKGERMAANTLEGEYGRYGRRGLPEGLEVVGENAFLLPERSMSVQALADHAETQARELLGRVANLSRFVLHQPE